MTKDSFTVGVFSNKGGSGKTTIAVHLALAWAQGAPTALLDVDPQGTATEWLKRRPADLKSPLAVPAAGREAVQQALKLARADRLVIERSGSDRGPDAGDRGGSRHHWTNSGPGTGVQTQGRVCAQCL